jgi:hypothetical protein
MARSSHFCAVTWPSRRSWRATSPSDKWVDLNRWGELEEVHRLILETMARV